MEIILLLYITYIIYIIIYMSEVTQSCPTLCNPMGCSLPGSSVHGIFQAIVLDWIAISFSNNIYILFLGNSITAPV